MTWINSAKSLPFVVVIGRRSERGDHQERAQATLVQLRHRPIADRPEALDEPFGAFPSWFLRIECDRCGKVRMIAETHARWQDRSLRDIIARMRHDGCGGRAWKAELLTGIMLMKGR